MPSDVNVCAETHSKDSEVSNNYKLSKERSNKSKRNNWLYNTSLFKQFQVNKYDQTCLTSNKQNLILC